MDFASTTTNTTMCLSDLNFNFKIPISSTDTISCRSFSKLILKLTIS